jgi:hypothetical protein
MAQRKNEMTSDDLMQLPDDIAGLVLDVQGRQTQQAAPVQREPEKTDAEPTPSVRTEHKPAPTAFPKEGNEWWNTFLEVGENYDFHVRKPDRKTYWVDEDIATTLKACNINRMSMSDKINAILRSFIELNKEELRQCFKQRDSLL